MGSFKVYLWHLRKVEIWEFWLHPSYLRESLVTQSLNIRITEISVNLRHLEGLHDDPLLASISFHLAAFTPSFFLFSPSSRLAIKVLVRSLYTNSVWLICYHLLHLYQRWLICLEALLEKVIELSFPKIDHTTTACNYLWITESWFQRV